MSLHVYLIVGSMRDHAGWAVLGASLSEKEAKTERTRLRWHGARWDTIDVEDVTVSVDGLARSLD